MRWSQAATAGWPGPVRWSTWARRPDTASARSAIVPRTSSPDPCSHERSVATQRAFGRPLGPRASCARRVSEGLDRRDIALAGPLCGQTQRDADVEAVQQDVAERGAGSKTQRREPRGDEAAGGREQLVLTAGSPALASREFALSKLPRASSASPLPHGLAVAWRPPRGDQAARARSTRRTGSAWPTARGRGPRGCRSATPAPPRSTPTGPCLPRLGVPLLEPSVGEGGGACRKRADRAQDGCSAVLIVAG